MARMTDSELKALVDQHMNQSNGLGSGELAVWRKKALEYYSGDAVGELSPMEIEGRSSVVSPDVRNTIEAMLPQLMVKFTGGDTVVEFEPQQRDDEDKAKLCTEYLNHLFFKNNGHNVTYSWFKDALIQKVGVVKVWWDTRNEQTREEYLGLSDIELAQLLDDPEVEPKEQSKRVDEEDDKKRQEALDDLGKKLQEAIKQPPPAPQPGQPPMDGPAQPQVNPAIQQLQDQIKHVRGMPQVYLHDVVVERTKKGGKVSIENVPPEEFFISSRAKSIENAAFVGHRFLRTISELRSMGYKGLDDLAGFDFDPGMENESYDDLSNDESQRLVWVREAYMRVDYDGDGIAELRKIVYAGDKILDNEIVDVAPFVSICPIPTPHKFFGLCPADLAMSAQKSKTSLLRAQHDNMNLQVNGRYYAVEGQVNLDDLVTSRPGGVVRMKNVGMAGRLDQGAGDLGSGMSMLEYMETALETSTGWTRYSQGNGPGPLQGTATGMNIITNKDDMRLDLIARNFAEGFTALFRQLLKLVCQHQNKRVEAKLAGQWVDIDPREWRNSFDIQINVGLGVGNKDQRIQHLMALLQHQNTVFPLGVSSPQTVYAASVELAKLQGFKNGDKFFSDPSQAEPKPPEPNPEQEKLAFEKEKFQTTMQAEAMKFQASAQAEQAKAQATFQIEQAKMEMQARVDQNRQQMEAGQQQMKAQGEAELSKYIAELDMQKDAAKAQAQIYIEQLRIDAENRRAQMDAETRLMVAQIAHPPQVQGLEAVLPDAGAIPSYEERVAPSAPFAQSSDPIAMAVRESLKSDPAIGLSKAPVNTTPAIVQSTDPMLLEMIQQLLEKVDSIGSAKSQPIKFIRGEDGKATGLNIGGVTRTIQRGKDGRMSHIN